MIVVRVEQRARALALLLGCSAPLGAEVEVSATIATDYVYRGLRQTTTGAAVQGSLEYASHTGWFAGVWASRVDFGGYDGRSAEFDYYAGYGWRHSPRLALEATVIRYTYQGNSPWDYDWTEVQLSGHLGDYWTVTGAVAEGWWGSDKWSTTLEGTFHYPLPELIILDATVGYQRTSQSELDHEYAAAGLSRPLGPFTVRVGYSVAEVEGGSPVAHLADDCWVASLTWRPER